MPSVYTLQPATDSLNAAYRPIILQFQYDNASNPLEVGYCDIYINNVFYKTISKTQALSSVASVSITMEYDIQDALQEYLQKFLADNGSSLITDASPVIGTVFCRVRKGYLDANGFIVTTNVAPVQATGSTPAVFGTGFQSNTFYVLNTTLQHEDNVVLQSHLQATKKDPSKWAADTFPLSHRPNRLSIGKENSDFFPLVYMGNNDLSCIRINYKYKGAAYAQLTDCVTIACVPVGIAFFTLPNGTQDVAYSKTVTLSGTGLPVLSAVVKPSWMTITVVSSTQITFTGTPTSGDLGTGITVSFTLTNDCGTVNVSKTLDVTATPICVPVSVSPTPDLPDGQVGVAYSYSFPVTGDAPFTLESVVKPAWMTINVIGSTIYFSGTPTVAGSIDVDFEIHNCGAGFFIFDDSADIDEAASTCRLHEFAVFGSDDSIWTIEAIMCDGSPYSDSGYVGDGAPASICAQPGTVIVGFNLVLIDSSTPC